MQFARKIVDPNQLSTIIELPEELLQSEVEIIVLPVEHSKKNKTRKKKGEDLIDRLQANPLKIENFTPFSREEIYER